MYDVSLEIAGPAAMWARPDTGSTPVSYPAPTFSAAKGIFEAVARKEGAIIRPTMVEICRPVRFERYTTGYGGPFRKPGQIKDDNNYQLMATILVDVCYRIYGVSELIDGFPRRPGNHAHALQEIFQRRLARGQWWSIPALGWKEFTPTYFGPVRNETVPDTTINLTIGSFLHAVFDRPVRGKVAPSFRQEVAVRNGVLQYEEQTHVV